MHLGISFVNRPVMATAINLVLLVVGLVAFQRLELRHTPNVVQNEITITTNYPGGNNTTIEQRITKPLEDALSGLDGIKKLSSESSDGQSQITIKFKPHVDSKKALTEVRDRVFSVQPNLPDGVKRSEIQESSENNKPILYMKFEDRNRNIAALSDFLRRNIEDRLRLLEGVASIERWGDKLYQITVQLDPARLAEQEITVSDVVLALKREKSFASGGEIEKNTGKETVVLTVDVPLPEDYKNITIKQKGSNRVRLQDVADIKITEKATQLKMRVDGHYQVGLSVNVKPGANPLQVAKRVRHFIKDLERNLPASMKVDITFDATKPFEAAIVSVQHALWEAIILVGIIVTLSLASIRAAILPMITIPLCLIGSFALMWIFGYSVNPVTMLALVLAVGLVVDDAIVVVENIHRHMENGLTALQAARLGMGEITFAIVVMTITLAAVYLPVAFQADDSAVMFREFAFTLAGSVIISGFVALTLTPALCGKYLKETHQIKTWDRINQRYRNFLNKSLNNPLKICILAVIVALLGIWGFNQLPSELMPTEDEDYIQGYISADNVVMDALREDWLNKVESVLKKIPEQIRYLTWEWQQRWLGWTVILKPSADRNKSVSDIIKIIQPEFDKIIGPKVGVEYGNSRLGNEENLKIIVQYNGDYHRLLRAIASLKKEAQNFPLFQNLTSEQLSETTRLKVIVDREMAQELGVSIETIEDALYTFLSGKKALDFNFQGFDYEVLVRAAPEYRMELEGINQFFVAGSEGQRIPLGSLISLQEVNEPNKIKHYERMRGAALTVNLKPGITIDKAMEILIPMIKKYIPEDAQYRFGGKAEQYTEAKQAMWLTYGLALIFIYLVLAALFESFVHPFVVLLTVPLSVAGAVWFVKAMGGTNNIYTAIGLVTLVGLITKHGILIVDFANRLKKTLSVKEAVLEAAERRLRPVLMTTFAMIFGAVPLLFGSGAGALARNHIGWVIIGGMATGTLFSLFVVPVVYMLIHRKKLSLGEVAQ